jgi:uncharacterized protein with von Willebrand factor type A (vWA) domain
MTTTQAFILHPLFSRLERELGYSIDLGRYFSLLQMAYIHLQSNVPLSKVNLYDVCRFLLCEKEQDEFRFKQIFDEVYRSEVVIRMPKKENVEIAKEDSDTAKEPTNDTNKKAVGQAPIEKDDSHDSKVTQEAEEVAVQEPWKTQNGSKFMNLNAAVESEENQDEIINEYDFLITEDYHSISFREMIQSWRYFRLRRRKGFSNRLDIVGTVKRIAAEGGLTQPVFSRDFANRDDALLILADRLGSMSPFHSLTDSLIRTARKEGGHEKAMVYFFQNYPLEYVFTTPWLTGPVKLDELLQKVNGEHTHVLIISDAGATRGNRNEQRIESTGAIRKENTWTLREDCFFYKLIMNVRDCVWLNPLPRERWLNTTADVIAATEGIKMHSVYDAGLLGFTNAIKDLLNEN